MSFDDILYVVIKWNYDVQLLIFDVYFERLTLKTTFHKLHMHMVFHLCEYEYVFLGDVAYEMIYHNIHMHMVFHQCGYACVWPNHNSLHTNSHNVDRSTEVHLCEYECEHSSGPFEQIVCCIVHLRMASPLHDSLL